MRRSVFWVRNFMALADDPERLREQYRSFSRQAPFMYFIFLLSIWTVAITHMVFASFWLTMSIPVLLTLVSAVLALSGFIVGNRPLARMVDTQSEAPGTYEKETRLLRMIDKMPVAVMTIDPDNLKITYVNETTKSLIRSVEHLLPIKADDLVGSSMDAFHKHPEHQRRILSNPANLPFHGRMNLGPEVLDVTVSPITADDGTYLGPMLTWAIVTQDVAAEKRIRQLAHYDALTGLANRVTFKEQMDVHFTLPGDGPNLLFIDLDGFKLVNDTRGHRVGDELLLQVANRLRAICDDPAVTIGRLGGDEFAVLVPGGKASELERLAIRIVDTLSMPYSIEQGRQVQIGASIGIALAPEHGDSGETLLAHADMALYASKAAGKGTYRFFCDDMKSRLQNRAPLHDEPVRKGSGQGRSGEILLLAENRKDARKVYKAPDKAKADVLDYSHSETSPLDTRPS